MRGMKRPLVFAEVDIGADSDIWSHFGHSDRTGRARL